VPINCIDFRRISIHNNECFSPEYTNYFSFDNDTIKKEGSIKFACIIQNPLGKNNLPVKNDSKPLVIIYNLIMVDEKDNK
jgi:hypothetical protein